MMKCPRAAEATDSPKKMRKSLGNNFTLKRFSSPVIYLLSFARSCDTCQMSFNDQHKLDMHQILEDHLPPCTDGTKTKPIKRKKKDVETESTTSYESSELDDSPVETKSGGAKKAKSVQNGVSLCPKSFANAALLNKRLSK